MICINEKGQQKMEHATDETYHNSIWSGTRAVFAIS